MKKTWIIGALILGLLSSCASTGTKVDNHEGHDHGLGASSLLFRIYEDGLNHLSAVRSGECPMHPSCSAYSKEAVQKHGPVMGWMMAVDRLMRCGRDEMKLAQKVWVDGKLKYYDPLDKNDFWWAKKKLTKK